MNVATPHEFPKASHLALYEKILDRVLMHHGISRLAMHCTCLILNCSIKQYQSRMDSSSSLGKLGEEHFFKNWCGLPRGLNLKRLPIICSINAQQLFSGKNRTLMYVHAHFMSIDTKSVFRILPL